MGLAQLPSGSEFDEFAEIVRDLAEEADNAVTWQDVLELIEAICQHPVRVFLCRACDLVTMEPGEDD